MVYREELLMAHIKIVSVAAAASSLDPFASAFLGLWAFVFAFILQGALGSKAQQ